jgi:trimethylamine--corrinoid protein Co-methyltransferase
MAGCSNAKVFDTQAAAEAALSLFNNMLGGANLIHDCGFLESSRTVSFELVALCDELIGWLRRYLRKLEINDETLALDLIHEASLDGGARLLEHPHTLRHLRKDWQPTLFDRGDYARWSGHGEITLEERANERVRGVLAEHNPVEPLPADVEQQLEEIISRR